MAEDLSRNSISLNAVSVLRSVQHAAELGHAVLERINTVFSKEHFAERFRQALECFLPLHKGIAANRNQRTKEGSAPTGWRPQSWRGSSEAACLLQIDFLGSLAGLVNACTRKNPASAKANMGIDLPLVFSALYSYGTYPQGVHETSIVIFRS